MPDGAVAPLVSRALGAACGLVPPWVRANKLARSTVLDGGGASRLVLREGPAPASLSPPNAVAGLSAELALAGLTPEEEDAPLRPFEREESWRLSAFTGDLEAAWPRCSCTDRTIALKSDAEDEEGTASLSVEGERCV